MEKFSVKKPFTILVAVIMVLLLGFVSITNLQTNLLPDISTPYLMVVTVYPGASPERVESEVSDVMENALGTVSGVESDLGRKLQPSAHEICRRHRHEQRDGQDLQ